MLITFILRSEYDTENIDWEPLENNQNKSMTGSAINMNVTARTSTDDEAFSSDFQWNLEDLSKAIKLLRQVPVDQIFSNEFDMRRIFAMVYDVYRRKKIQCIPNKSSTLTYWLNIPYPLHVYSFMLVGKRLVMFLQ